jgi:formylglycine-generating enzyme required for sulfatase activity
VRDEEHAPTTPHFRGVKDNWKYAAPVGSFSANAFGLKDMIGNVSEWCADWHATDFYSRSPLIDPHNQRRTISRVDRGGSWATLPWHTHCANRGASSDDTPSAGYGFRVCVEIHKASAGLPEPRLTEDE